MAGCDYNHNIKGIGMMKAKKMLDKTKDGSIDSLKLKDSECLNVETCRRLFKLLSCDEMKTCELKLDLDLEKLEDAKFKYEECERMEIACQFCIKCQFDTKREEKETIKLEEAPVIIEYKGEDVDDFVINENYACLVGDCSFLD
jgi:hypothetical protein